MTDRKNVTIKGPDGKRHKVTPEVARVAVADRGFEYVGGAPARKDEVAAAVEQATAPLKARIAELEAQLADATKAQADTAAPAKSEAPKAKTDQKEG